MECYAVIEILILYLGGWDNLIKAYTLIIAAELITEVMVSIAKSYNLSRLTLILFFQKTMEYIIIGLSNTIDTCIVREASFRELVIVFYFVYECLKILDNAVEIGLPIPYKIKKVLERIFNKEYNKEGNQENHNS